MKLTDFGLSRQINLEGSLKMTIKVGNYAYHAPETFTSAVYDQRSDVWGAGLILYQMLTGQLCREYPIKSEQDIDRRNADLLKGNISLKF
jgi:serine/threonine protein kinase